MRTLTVNEIGTVSGGEAPCVTLRTQCVGPAPTAKDVSNGLYGVAAVAANFVKSAVATRIAAAAALAAYLLEQVDD